MDTGHDFEDRRAARLLGVPVEDADFLVELSNHLVEGTGDRPSLPADAYGNTTELRHLPFGSAASHARRRVGSRNEKVTRRSTRSHQA